MSLGIKTQLTIEEAKEILASGRQTAVAMERAAEKKYRSGEINIDERDARFRAAADYYTARMDWVDESLH